MTWAGRSRSRSLALPVSARTCRTSPSGNVLAITPRLIWSLTRMPAGRPARVRAIVAAHPRASASMAQLCPYVNGIVFNLDNSRAGRAPSHHPRGARRRGQLVEQRLRLPQVRRVESLGESAVDGREELARLAASALVAPQPGEARRRAQLPRACRLTAGERQCAPVAVLGLGMAFGRQPSQRLALASVQLGLEPPLAGPFRPGQRLVQRP